MKCGGDVCRNIYMAPTHPIQGPKCHNVCYCNGVPVCQRFVPISPFDYRGAVVNQVFCQWLAVGARDQHSTFTRVVVGAEREFRVGAGTAVSPRDVGARMAAASVVRQTLVDI